MIDLVLAANPDVVMIVKSSIPVSYTSSLYKKCALQFLLKPELKDKHFNSLFSPEFLRENNGVVCQPLSESNHRRLSKDYREQGYTS